MTANTVYGHAMWPKLNPGDWFNIRNDYPHEIDLQDVLKGCPVVRTLKPGESFRWVEPTPGPDWDALKLEHHNRRERENRTGETIWIKVDHWEKSPMLGRAMMLPAPLDHDWTELRSTYRGRF